jgi:hypothetical protein
MEASSKPDSAANIHKDFGALNIESRDTVNGIPEASDKSSPHAQNGPEKSLAEACPFDFLIGVALLTGPSEISSDVSWIWFM